MPKWKKSPDALVQRFEETVGDLPNVEKRPMFGYPCIFLNGNLVTGLHEDRWILRLSERDRKEFAKLPSARPFEPMPGRAMREYMVAPRDLVENDRALRSWLDRSLKFVRSLPTKERKEKRPPSRK